MHRVGRGVQGVLNWTGYVYLAGVIGGLAVGHFLYRDRIDGLAAQAFTAVLGGWPRLAVDVALVLWSLFLGGLLYRQKSLRPALYGAAEVLLGASLATYIADALVHHTTATSNAFFAAVGSLYVIVRGLETLEKVLARGSRTERLWRSYFFAPAAWW
ncbi:MAG TPA: hypothetical protein VMI56_12985 [Reyranella sp.]|nr:hypothetical protein [Reyranella sp.]